MNSVKVLLLEQESGDPLVEVLQKLSESAPTPFQIDRHFIKELEHEILQENVPFPGLSPDIVLLLISSVSFVRQTAKTVVLIKQRFVDVPILAIISSSEPYDISQLMDLNVDDFMTSPIRPDEILVRARRLLKRNDTLDVSQSIKQKFGLKQMIGESPSFLSEIKKIPVLAKSDTIVFITGETGTGKELCARAIHYLSPRHRYPFIPVNCGAIPVDLVENELFGHEKGAFTGATESRTGLIAEAEGGTVFLDEIDCLPLAAQVKLLRFLQEKEYRPLGTKKMKKADVRLLAAMNMDVQEAVAGGKLRQDLYYRLNVIPLIIPPLRERREDIPLLACHFLEKYAVQFNKPLADFTPEAMQLLQIYDWPGNVRELEHIVERAVVLSESRVIQAKDVVLPTSESELQESFHDAKLKMIAAFEKMYIERLLLAHHGNISQAARAAQKNRRAFWELVRKHQIEVESFKT
jgi:DNA-binding NtrC family response regulator